MHVSWCGEEPLHSHADWRERLGKNSKHGTSAPTLAAAWAGPVEVYADLRLQTALQDLGITQLLVEEQFLVDELTGPRQRHRAER